MTPQQIAQEAAHDMLDKVYRHVGSPAQVEASLVPLILSAAAKIVRESGAVEALERIHERSCPLHGNPHTYLADDRQDARLALAKLRAIAGGKP